MSKRFRQHVPAKTGHAKYTLTWICWPRWHGLYLYNGGFHKWGYPKMDSFFSWKIMKYPCLGNLQKTSVYIYIKIFIIYTFPWIQNLSFGMLETGFRPCDKPTENKPWTMWRLWSKPHILLRTSRKFPATHLTFISDTTAELTNVLSECGPCSGARERDANWYILTSNSMQHDTRISNGFRPRKRGETPQKKYMQR